MKNKYKAILAVCCAVMTVSLCACTADTSESSSASQSSEAQTTTTTTATDDAQTSTETTTEATTTEPSEILSSSTTDAVPDLTGLYMENQGSDSESYIIVNGSGGYIYAVGSKLGVPMDITLTADTILVDRGGVSGNTEPSGYTYDGATIAFTGNGNTYLWTAIDYIPIDGLYHQVDSEGTYLADWTFNTDGSGSIVEKDSEEQVPTDFTQTADTLSISRFSSDNTTSYSYVNNVSTISLTAPDGTVINLQADGT